MDAISPERMRLIDRYTIEEIGIPSLVLMENAARSVFEELDTDINESFLIFAGCGNNGADGLVVARHLNDINKSVEVVTVGDIANASAEFLSNLQILVNEKVRIKKFNDFSKGTSDNKYDVIVDAIFGTGLRRNLSGEYERAVEWINSHSDDSMVVAVDIPSGLDGATGDIRGVCVCADVTVTFHKIKTGMLNRTEFTGAIAIKNIGVVEPDED